MHRRGGYAAAQMADPVADEMAVPQFVNTDAERERWRMAVRVASEAMGEPASNDTVHQAARVIYHDQENYPT